MTITPLTPAAAPVPTPGAAAGSKAPGDFLAEFLQAMSAEPATPGSPAPVDTVPVPDSPGLGEPVETPAGSRPAANPAIPATPTLVEPVETPAAHPQTPTRPGPRWMKREPVAPVVCDPNVTATIQPTVQPTVQAPVQSPVQPPVQPGAPTTSGAVHLGRVDNPGLHLGVGHSGRPVNPKHDALHPTSESPTPASPAPVDPTADGTAPAAPQTDDAPHVVTELDAPTPIEQPTATVAPPTAPASVAPASVAPASVAPTTPTAPPVSAPSISDQVFGEITGLASRGNGTHRITMKLQPEALGEVRVVLTVREGTVHVRLAAGQQASAALLAGSPELKALLEHAGATDTKIVVRELPASAVSTVQQANGAGQAGTQHGHQYPAGEQAAQPGQSAPTQTPTTDTTTPGHSGLAGGDRSPDRHAGTRADHLATDGDDTTRGHRTGGRRDVTPIRSVETRAAGVDLTM